MSTTLSPIQPADRQTLAPQLDPSHAELADLVAAYDRDGYIDGGCVLDQPTLEHLRNELDRVIADHGKAGVPQPFHLHNMAHEGRVTWQIVNIYLGSAAFHQLIRNPRIGAIAGALLRTNTLRLWHDQIQYKQAGNGGVTWWHQDWPYWQAIQPGHEMVSAWVALDDVDADNGCMSMVPGSHNWGNRIDFLHGLNDHSASYDSVRMLAAIPETFSELPGRPRLQPQLRPVPAGHVHFHHAFTWHGSHANTSQRPRRAIAIHLMSDRACYRAEGRHMLRPHIHVADGERLEGELFPICWQQPNR